MRKFACGLALWLAAIAIAPPVRAQAPKASDFPAPEACIPGQTNALRSQKASPPFTVDTVVGRSQPMGHGILPDGKMLIHRAQRRHAHRHDGRRLFRSHRRSARRQGVSPHRVCTTSYWIRTSPRIV